MDVSQCVLLLIHLYFGPHVRCRRSIAWIDANEPYCCIVALHYIAAFSITEVSCV